MSEDRGHVLIAGASGVIGTAAVQAFARGGWAVTALSRRAPVIADGLEISHASVDLADAGSCRAAAAQLAPVTHLVFAAVSEAPGLAPGWRDPDQIARNGAMFANLLAPLEAAGTLRHATILQGAKAYGGHVHPVTVPMRERAPRDDHPNFYWLHEDRLREGAARHGYAFTIFRPQVLLGWAPGAAMNPVAAIGAYAALCQRFGWSFALPGESESLWEMVDTELMAEALVWAATSPQAAGQTFNITNGDVFVLRHDWPELAARLNLASAGTAPLSFTGLFADPQVQAQWGVLAAEYGLAERSLPALIGQSDAYLDMLLAPRIAAKPSAALMSTIKLRQAGFGGCRDSFEALLAQLGNMTQRRLLPPLHGSVDPSKARI